MNEAIEFFFGPHMTTWGRLLICGGLLAIGIIWFLRPIHWSDFEKPNAMSDERIACPPD